MNSAGMIRLTRNNFKPSHLARLVRERLLRFRKKCGVGPGADYTAHNVMLWQRNAVAVRQVLLVQGSKLLAAVRAVNHYLDHHLVKVRSLDEWAQVSFGTYVS